MTARRRRRSIPASYDGVIGVTAVDAKHHVLIEACRGKQVDFAAPGADMQRGGRGRRPDIYVPVRGTSFAAPLVAGLLAADLKAPDPVARRETRSRSWTAHRRTISASAGATNLRRRASSADSRALGARQTANK